MESIPCPGCRTMLGPEVTSCPICTRPRSKYEITRAYATLRAQEARRRKLPFVIAAYLLAAGGIGWAVFKFRAPLSGAAAAARARAKRFMDDATDPKRLTSQASQSSQAPEEPPPPPAPVFSSPAGQAPTGMTAAVPSAARPMGAPTAGGALAPVRPKVTGDLPLQPMDPTTQWALRGWVYDLVTLQPVPSVSFAVRGPNGGMMGSFLSDMDGRYLVVLPRLSEGGYEIVGSAPGYASAVYYESDIPYAQLSDSERKELAANARVGDNHPSPLSDLIGEDSIHRDLFVVPRR